MTSGNQVDWLKLYHVNDKFHVGPITKHLNTKAFLEKMHVPEIFESLLGGLMLECPEDHVNYIDHKLTLMSDIGWDKLNWETFIEPLHRKNDPIKKMIYTDCGMIPDKKGYTPRPERLFYDDSDQLYRSVDLHNLASIPLIFTDNGMILDKKAYNTPSEEQLFYKNSDQLYLPIDLHNLAGLPAFPEEGPYHQDDEEQADPASSTVDEVTMTVKEAFLDPIIDRGPCYKKEEDPVEEELPVEPEEEPPNHEPCFKLVQLYQEIEQNPTLECRCLISSPPMTLP